MPKGKFNKEKRLKLQEERSMSMKERDKIKDPKKRIEIAKLQAQSKGRTITPEQLEAEKQAKSAPVKGVTVKVRPLVKQSGSTQQTEPQGTKSTGSTQTYAEKKKQHDKLEQYREQLSSLVQRANERVDILNSLSAEKFSKNEDFASRALDAARASLPESRDTNGDLFTANLRTEKQIKRELSRVMTFLNDPTSLSSGAEQFTEDLTAAGLFGGQYRANGGPGYDEERVSKEVGEQVFDIYGKVLAQEGGWERVMGYFKANSGGLIEYGSENLINAIYEMTVQLGTSDAAQEEIINRAKSMIDDMIDSYKEMAVKQRVGVDYGLIGYDETADDRRNHWQWNMQRKGLL